MCWGEGEARLLSVSGLAPSRGLSPVVALLRLPPLRSLLPLHAGWTQAVEYPEHLLPAHAASLRLRVAAPPLGPPRALGWVGNDRRPVGPRESCGSSSGPGGPMVLPGIEAALAKAVVLHAEGEEAAGCFALHGVSFTVQAEAGGGGWGRAGTRQHHAPPGGRARRTAASGSSGAHLCLRSSHHPQSSLHASALGLDHPLYPGPAPCRGLSLLEAFVTMRLRVHGDVEGAPRRGAADLDEGELGDGERRRSLRLGGPGLLLVLLPALILVVDELQVVLHQVHVLGKVALVQPSRHTTWPPFNIKPSISSRDRTL